MRQGVARGSKLAMSGNPPKPSEVVEGGMAIIGTLDLNGQGVWQISKDGAGCLIIKAANNFGEGGPSLVLDAKSNCAFLSAGTTQIRVDGNMGHVYATSQIIWEQPYYDVATLASVTLSNIVSYFAKHASPNTNSAPADVESYSDGIVTTA